MENVMSTNPLRGLLCLCLVGATALSSSPEASPGAPFTAHLAAGVGQVRVEAHRLGGPEVYTWTCGPPQTSCEHPLPEGEYFVQGRDPSNHSLIGSCPQSADHSPSEPGSCTII